MRKELEVGDYIVFPNHSNLEYAKVLKIIKNKYGSNNLKLSCQLRNYTSIRKNYFYKIATTNIDDLKEHNSFCYKEHLGYLIVNDYVTEGVDETKLKSRKQLYKENE
jgi:hypothetical protein